MQVAIFLCNKETMAECLEKKLFGSSAPYAKSVRKGDVVLLYNVAERFLYGVWTAASNGGTFDVRAWGGSYPHQAKVTLASKEMIRLPKYCFGDILGAEGGWGKAITGTKAHNLLQYFAFEYQGTMGLGVPLHEMEKSYRAAHPARFACADGHKVRFGEEGLVDECLSRLKIPHAYELVIALPPVQLVPTFAVHRPSGESVYIECACGDGDSLVQARRAHKQGIYEERGFRLVDLGQEDLRQLDSSLAVKLGACGVKV